MSFIKKIINWLNEEPAQQPTTSVTVKNTGDAVAVGKGSYSNTGVTIRGSSSEGSVIMTGSKVTIRGQRGPVNINGKIYNKGDKLPEGVDITWC